MLKVGFYLRNRDISEADLRYPPDGNPGVGGTQFMLTALPWYLERYHGTAVDPHIYANVVDRLPPDIATHEVRNASAAVKEAKSDNVDILVFRPTGDREGMRIFPELKATQLSALAWAQNNPPGKCLRAITESEFVKRFVAGGREQLDELRDHNVFGKSTYIYNCIDPTTFEPSSVQSDSKKVVYVGALVPVKGFHILARAWKRIVSEVPEAKLIVIGSGRLYDEDARMGKWNVAEENYESKKIRPYLSNEHGSPMESVDFKGVMGRDKVPIMQEASVGVVNPSGKSETFCISAVEFQAAGTPVVSKSYRGLLDTVQHEKTGLLGSESDLADNVISLLKDPNLSRAMGENGISRVKRQFSFESVCQDWVQLFKNIQAGQPAKNDYPLVNLSNNLKFLREGMRRFKLIVPGGKRIPSIYDVKEGFKRIYQNI